MATGFQQTFPKQEKDWFWSSSPQDCQPCLITQIKLLEHVYQNQDPSKRFPIYAFANAPAGVLKRYKRSFNLHYELLPDTENMLFQNEMLTHRTPAIFVVNEKNIITHCHLCLKRSPSKYSPLFWCDSKTFAIAKTTSERSS